MILPVQGLFEKTGLMIADRDGAAMIPNFFENSKRIELEFSCPAQ
jgi:hypothetical protein